VLAGFNPKRLVLERTSAGFQILLVKSRVPDRHYGISGIDLFSGTDFFASRRQAKMSQRDLWEKAAECARAIEATTDPARREMLTHLQMLWTNLANAGPFLGRAKLADQVAAIGRIHVDLMQAAINQVTSSPPLHAP
jgi:hypothetical protein